MSTLQRFLRTARVILVLVGCLVLQAGVADAQQAQRTVIYDVLIKGGHVLDGTGNPWFRSDVGIDGDRIVAMGILHGATGRREIDATGRVVIPGFIDLHTHADEPNGRSGIRSEDPRRRAALNYVAQGVTTVVANQDGRSPLPIADQIASVRELGTGTNVIVLVGHGSVRTAVLGRDIQRPSTPEEVAQMQEMVRQGMQEGAWGMSAGLEYSPGIWSETDEVVAMASEIVPYGGVYISHERSEGADPMWYWPSQDEPGPPTLLDAVMETIEIGERTGATVVCSHIKAKGAHYWGSSAAVIQLIQAARNRGVSVWADQYSYETSGTDGSTVLIPDWVFRVEVPGSEPQAAQGQRGRGRPDAAAQLGVVMADEKLNADLRRDIAHEIRRRGGAGKLIIMEYPDSSFVGRSLADVARDRDLSPLEMAITLQLEGDLRRRGGARMRGFSMSEIDLAAYARQPWTATASDAGISLPGDGPVHARFYGNFARKVHYFAMEKGWISIEHAIRSGTSLPAQILGLKDRGQVREGFYADLAVIDLANYRDTATFFEPHQYATGVDCVLVNGQFVVDGGKLTEALPGKVLTPLNDHR